ncbi:MAG: hypothetical protein OXG38_12335 [Chloroflexi bacterium]|nr:hypothetical protein [Chloroflexota bacterium]
MIAAGQTAGAADVWLEHDTVREGDEQFEVVLTHADGATIATGVALMTIRDDD